MNKEWGLRGFHMRFGSHEDVGYLKRVISEAFVPMGVNVLVLECNTSFQFSSHPEVSGGTLTRQDARELCRRDGLYRVGRRYLWHMAGS